MCLRQQKRQRKQKKEQMDLVLQWQVTFQYSTIHRIPALNKSDYGVCDNKKDKKDKENKKKTKWTS